MQQQYPDTDELDFDELVAALKDELGPGVVGPEEYQHSDGVWLPKSWLGIALTRVSESRPDGLGLMPARQRLVTICNRSDVDVEPVLEADDPRVEVEAVYRAVVDAE